MTAVYDPRGNIIEEAYQGVDGEPTLRKGAGVARVASIYDVNGNKVEEAFSGVDGAPALHKDLGAARVTYAYDARGDRVEIAFFGIDGKPALHKDWGAARMKAAYDARGNAIEGAFFGVNGEPVLHTDFGCFRIVKQADAYGNTTEETCHGKDGALIESAFGFAQARAKRDALGRMLEERYFDRNGHPVLRANRLMKGEDIEDLFGEWHDLVLSGALEEAKIKAIGWGGFARIEQAFELARPHDAAFFLRRE